MAQANTKFNSDSYASLSRLFLFAFALIVFGGQAFASPTKSECAELPKLLKDLQKAQKAVSESLIQNHEIMSETLSSYSETVMESQGKAYKAIARNMGNASEGFKSRADKATRHTTLIFDNTSEIISLVEGCLAQ